MNRDAKEIVGALMQILGGAEVPHDQLTELSFEADGELQHALNDAYIKIMEFAFDRDLRVRDPALDQAMRGALQTCLHPSELVCLKRREGHIFFDGVVIRRLTQSDDGAWYVTTHGFGNNAQPGTNGVNQLVGPEVFDELDRQMRAYIERHHAKGALLDLPVHRMVGGGRYGSGPAVVGARHEIA